METVRTNCPCSCLVSGRARAVANDHKTPHRTQKALIVCSLVHSPRSRPAGPVAGRRFLLRRQIVHTGAVGVDLARPISEFLQILRRPGLDLSRIFRALWLMFGSPLTPAAAAPSGRARGCGRLRPAPAVGTVEVRGAVGSITDLLAQALTHEQVLDLVAAQGLELEQALGERLQVAALVGQDLLRS